MCILAVVSFIGSLFKVTAMLKLHSIANRTTH